MPSYLLRACLASFLLLAVAFPLQSAEAVPIYDVTITYTLDDAAQTVEYAVAGAYTHTIGCEAGWTLVSQTTESTLSQSHVIEYRISYAAAVLSALEQSDGQVTETQLQCAEPQLNLISLLDDPDQCIHNWATSYKNEPFGSLVRGYWNWNSPCIEVYLQDGTDVPFSGGLIWYIIAQDYSVMYKRIPHCNAIGGVCWNDVPEDCMPGPYTNLAVPFNKPVILEGLATWACGSLADGNRVVLPAPVGKWKLRADYGSW